MPASPRFILASLILTLVLTAVPFQADAASRTIIARISSSPIYADEIEPADATFLSGKGKVAGRENSVSPSRTDADSA